MIMFSTEVATMIFEKTLIQSEKELAEITSTLKNMPDGSLIVKKNGDYNQYFDYSAGKATYIPKHDIKKAETLALKKYYLKKQDILIQYVTNLKQLVQQQHLLNKLDKDFIGSGSKYHDLLDRYLSDTDDEIKTWLFADLPENPFEPQNKKIETLDGNLVRSKSEAMIADSLYIAGIPYRYECPLELSGRTIFPDFTAIRKHDNARLYWEHFGIMDNYEYAKKACNKILNYSTEGIIPGINLITTYETAEYPLDSAKIRTVIEEYFS